MVDRSTINGTGSAKTTTALEIKVGSQSTSDVCALPVNPVFTAGAEN